MVKFFASSSGVGQQNVSVAFPGHSHFLNKLIIILSQILFDAKGLVNETGQNIAI